MRKTRQYLVIAFLFLLLFPVGSFAQTRSSPPVAYTLDPSAYQKRTEQRLYDLEQAHLYQSGTLGFGFVFPSKGLPPYPSLEASFGSVYILHYAGAGTGFGVRPRADVGRVRFEPIGLGFFFTQGDRLLSVRHIPREWDFHVTSSVAVQLYENWTMRGQISWHFPAPSAPYHAAEDAARAEVQRIKNEIVRDFEAGKITTREEFEKQLDEAGTRVVNSAATAFGDAYEDAAYQPIIGLSIQWLF